MSLSTYASQILVRLVPQALGMGAQIALKRIAGLEIIGQFSIIVAVATVTFGVASSAIDTNLLRHSKLEQFGAALQAKLFLWLALLPLLLVVLFTLKIPAEAALAVYGGMFGLHGAQLLAVYFRAGSRDVKAVAPAALPPLLYVIGLVVFRPTSLVAVAAIYLLAWCSAGWYLYRSGLLSAALLASWLETRAVIGSSLIIMGSLVFTQLYANIDLFLINYMLGSSAAGIYRIALSFAAIAIPTIGALSHIYLSRLAQLVAQGDWRGIRSVLVQQILLNLMAGGLFFGGAIIFVPFVLPLLFGSDVSAGISTSLILSGGVILNVLGMVFSYTLLAFRKDRVTLFTLAAACAINLGLNLCLIPRLGVNGGAWTNVITQAVILGVQAYYTIRFLIDQEHQAKQRSFSEVRA